jgi:hypothetical protein
MKSYSGPVDLLFGDSDLLKKLLPTEPSNASHLIAIRAATDLEISGGRPISDSARFPLVRAALFYACDAIAESHRIVQDAGGDEGAYWHGMIHRREGDFDNARYWFRRAGILPFFGELHHQAGNVAAVVASQSNWDPYLFTGLCEQDRFGDTDARSGLLKLQRIEFDVAFGYLWRTLFP